MGEKGLSVEGELQSQMTNLYEKNVPLATRRYLERNNPPEERTTELADEPKRGRSMTDEERRGFNARRREQRKVEKAQKDAPAPLPENTPSQEMVM